MAFRDVFKAHISRYEDVLIDIDCRLRCISHIAYVSPEFEKASYDQTNSILDTFFNEIGYHIKKDKVIASSPKEEVKEPTKPWSLNTYAVQVKGPEVGKIEKILQKTDEMVWLEEFKSYMIGNPEYSGGVEYVWCNTWQEAHIFSYTKDFTKELGSSLPTTASLFYRSDSGESVIQEEPVLKSDPVLRLEPTETINKKHQEEVAPIFDVKKPRAVIKIKIQ